MNNTDEYTGPPCPHGHADPWDCTICSAAHFGGHTWRTCRHGWRLGECPTCDAGDAGDVVQPQNERR